MKDWTVSATCPHGVAFRVPVRAFYSMDWVTDGCEQAELERLDAQASKRVGRFAAWREARRFRRELNSVTH